MWPDYRQFKGCIIDKYIIRSEKMIIPELFYRSNKQPLPLTLFQGFSLTEEKLLRTSLQCVVVKGSQPGVRPLLEDCIIGPRDTWVHKRVSL